MNSQPISSHKPALYYFNPNHTDYNSDLDLGESDKSYSDYDDNASLDLDNTKPNFPANTKVLRFEDVISANKDSAPEKLNSQSQESQDDTVYYLISTFPYR